MNHYIHPAALCETDTIGEGTRIWAFAHLLPGSRVGRNCNICDGVFIEGGVVIGDRVTVKCGVQLWDGVTLGDDVFVGPNATFTNDLFPRSRQHPAEYVKTVVENGASIGANATILAGVRIGRGAMIGAGAVVTRSVPPNAIITGNPGRIKGYVTTSANKVDTACNPSATPKDAAATPSALDTLPIFNDIRGSLTVGNFGAQVPFAPARFFMVFGVPSRETRGEHAHRNCHQYLLCVAGSVRVLADDGTTRIDLLLDAPNKGLHLPPMTWGTQYDYSPDAVLLVFASHPYDSEDYIRDYAEFVALAQSRDSE